MIYEVIERDCLHPIGDRWTKLTKWSKNTFGFRGIAALTSSSEKCRLTELRNINFDREVSGSFLHEIAVETQERREAAPVGRHSPKTPGREDANAVRVD